MALTQLPKEVSLRWGGGPAVWKKKRKRKTVVRGRNPATVVRGRNPAGMSGGGGARGGVGDGGSPPSRPRGLSAILAPSGARKFFDLKTPPVFAYFFARGRQQQIVSCEDLNGLRQKYRSVAERMPFPLTCLKP